MSRLITAVMWMVVLGIACSQSPAYRISEVGQEGESSVLFLEIDPAKADLPWTLQRSKVRIATSDGQVAPIAAFGIKGPLAFGVDAVTVKRGDDQSKLAVDILGDSNTIGQLRSLSRSPSPGEIALLVDLPRAKLKELEIELDGGRLIRIPVPPTK